MPIAGGGLPFPTIHVEIGFASSLLDPLSSIVWTDVTPWLLEFDVFTGRSHELGRAEPGSGSLRLNNRDRRFDPTSTSGPYGADLRPMRRFRLAAEWSGTRYPLWCGYVRTFQPSWPSATSSEVTVPLADGFYALNLQPVVSTAYYDAVMDDAPARYYRLGEPPGASNALDASGNGAHGVYLGVPSLGQSGALVTETDAAVDFGSDAGHVDCPDIPAPGSGAFSWECWLHTTADAGMAMEADQLAWTGFGAGHQLDIEFAGVATAVLLVPGGGGAITVSSTAVNDGNWHHIVWTRDSAGTTYRLYVDGVLEATTVSSVITVAGPLSFGIARAGSHQSDLTGNVDEVAVYTHELSADQVKAHYDAGAGVWADETTGERLNTILDTIGVAAADRAIDAGITTLQPVTETLTKTMAFAHMAEVADTEGGLLFVDPDGKYAFHDRHRILSGQYLTSQATFGDGPGEFHYDSDGLVVSPDEEDLWSSVLGQRRNGGAQVVEDATARAAYGFRQLQKTELLGVSDYEVKDRATWDLEHYRIPRQRARSIRLKPTVDETLWPEVLGRLLHDRITVKARPVGGGAPFSQECLIEGVRHHYVAGESWETNWSTSVAEIDGYWRLDTSALDSDTRLAY